ncbi:Tkp1 protein, partial [Vanderwaltozyma polyspora DSM 70294]
IIIETCQTGQLIHKLFIVQLDISSPYLYANLKEELYIRTPPHLGHKNKVFKVQKSLYGLKQSSGNWYENIKKFRTETCGMSSCCNLKCMVYINRFQGYSYHVINDNYCANNINPIIIVIS